MIEQPLLLLLCSFFLLLILMCAIRETYRNRASARFIRACAGARACALLSQGCIYKVSQFLLSEHYEYVYSRRQRCSAFSKRYGVTRRAQTSSQAFVVCAYTVKLFEYDYTHTRRHGHISTHMRGLLLCVSCGAGVGPRGLRRGRDRVALLDRSRTTLV